MKKLALGSPRGDNDIAWAIRSLKTIERASFEDIEATMNDFSTTGDYVPTRTIDASTATLTDLIAFVATMVSDIQQRGQHRDGGST